MSHPLDKHFDDLLKATADGPDAMTKWLKDLQEEVGAPDGPELPETIEIGYADGTTEVFDTTGKNDE